MAESTPNSPAPAGGGLSAPASPARSALGEHRRAGNAASAARAQAAAGRQAGGSAERASPPRGVDADGAPAVTLGAPLNGNKGEGLRIRAAGDGAGAPPVGGVGPAPKESAGQPAGGVVHGTGAAQSTMVRASPGMHSKRKLTPAEK